MSVVTQWSLYISSSTRQMMRGLTTMQV